MIVATSPKLVSKNIAGRWTDSEVPKVVEFGVVVIGGGVEPGGVVVVGGGVVTGG